MVVFWAAVAVAVYIYLPPLDEQTTGSVSDLVPDSAPAAQAQAETASRLSGPVETPAILVYSNPDGFSAADTRRIAENLASLTGPDGAYRLDRAVPLVIQDPVDTSPVSGVVGRNALPVLLFFERGISPTGTTTGVTEVREAVQNLPGGLSAGVTGVQPIQDENELSIVENLPLVTLATALAIFLIVAFTYRSPLTPLVPLASIGLAIFLTLRILARVAASQGQEVPSQVEPIIVVLLFGVGTDYALFLLSRTRRALSEGVGKVEAARLAVERVGGVLLSSVAVLIASFGLLVFADLGLYQALGPGLGIALAIVFAVTLTLVPALLAIFGRAAFGGLSETRSSGSPGSVTGSGNWRERLNGALLRRPGISAGALCLVLLVLASGALGLRVGFDQVENLPDDAPAVEGYEMLTEGFPGGLLAPVNVLVQSENGQSLADQPQQLRRLRSELLGAGGFAAAIGPQNSGLLPGLQFISGDGTAVRYLLIFYDAPYTPEALDQISRLQENLPELLDNAGFEEARATVGGQTALAAAARDTSGSDLRSLAPLVFLASYIVLALLLRTLVAPVYLLFATALSFGATIGVATILFQDVLGQGGVVYYVPFALFLLLIALGSDYNIFIMAAIREEAREKPLAEAVPLALSRTGPTISAAGIALASSFALLTLIPLQDFFQVGIAVAIGILLDAFVIRTLLVPSLALLLGRFGFWPSKPRS